jgi:uncharacterized protein (TIGR02444 family)
MPSLWEFSLRLYAAEPVARACLALQDRHGVDVNLLLYALWRGACHGARMEAAEFVRVRAQTEAWRTQVVQPLRTVRRALKAAELDAFHSGASALRARVKSIELEAERLEQEYLQQLAAAGHAGRDRPAVTLALANAAALLATHANPAPGAGAQELRDIEAVLASLKFPPG